MDIESFISSSIILRSDGFCYVEFPSFSGWCETILYNTHWWRKNIGNNELSPHFRCDDFIHDTSKIILASRIFDCIALRIIDRKEIYSESLFLIHEWEVFSFILKEKTYFVFIYTDINYEKSIFTDYEKDEFFTWRWENNIFSIINTLTEIVIFEKKISIMNKKYAQFLPTSLIENYSICLISDPFLENTERFLTQFFSIPKLQKNTTITQNEDIRLITFHSLSEEELKSIIWFFGRYTCILFENPLWLSGFLSTLEATDLSFHLPENFHESEDINLLDPRWHKMRIWILEIYYQEFLLREARKNLMEWVESIESLQENRILFQKIRLNITLENIERIYPVLQKQKDILTKLIQQKIS